MDESGQKKTTRPSLSRVVVILLFVAGAAVVLFYDTFKEFVLPTPSEVEMIQERLSETSSINTEFKFANEPQSPFLFEEAEVTSELSDLQGQVNRLEAVMAQLQQSTANTISEAEVLELLATNFSGIREVIEQGLEDQQRRLQDEMSQMRRGLLSDRPDTAPAAPFDPYLQEQVSSSGLVFDLHEGGNSQPTTSNIQTSLSDSILSSRGVSLPGAEATPGDSNVAFLEAATSRDTKTQRAKRLANIGRTIAEGTILEATLETAITTDLPGNIRAVLSNDAFSFDGNTVLMPRGTRLIGSYNSELNLGQRRVVIAWRRAITPTGTTINLAAFGSDALGRAGQAGSVDTKFLERFGGAFLISFIDGASRGDGMADEQVAIASGVESGLSPISRELLRRQPTIHVDQGEALTIMVLQDLVF